MRTRSTSTNGLGLRTRSSNYIIIVLIKVLHKQALGMSAPSYEKTLEHYDVSDSEMKVECPDDAIYTLAKKMTRWRSIDLGVDRGVVNGIENERLDDEGKRRQLLERWKERYGHEATYDRLARSFFESERLDLAGAVCKEFRDKNTRTCEGELFFRVLCKLYKSMGVVFNMFSVDTQIISGTEIFQTFSAHAPATGDDSASAVGRDVAASPPVETVGAAFSHALFAGIHS